MTDRLKVVYWNNQPTPYLVARLNAVVKHSDLDLEVWFDQEREPDRSWEVPESGFEFRWRMVGSRKLLGRRIQLPVTELTEARPDVIVCNYDRAHIVLGALTSTSLAARTTLRVLPAYAAQSQITLVKGWVWRLLFRAVDGAKVPGADGRRFAERYGLPADRCWEVTQSIDVELFGRARGRRRRDITAPARFVTVSRMVPSKGVDVLLTAWRAVRESLPGAALVMAGDGSDEQRLRELSADMREVTWLGFRQQQDLPEVYSDADVLVFPTLGDPNGLVVEEAMAAGLAVISTDAAGDIRQRVPENDAGWVVPAGDVDSLAAALTRAAELGVERLGAIGEANARRVQRFAPESYARDFENFCREVAARPPRRNLAARVARGVSWMVRGLWHLTRR